MSDINKFTSKEVLNKVLLDSSGNAVEAFSHTTQEALNAALDTTNNRLNVSLAGGTISGDVTISGDLTVNGSATNSYDEIVNGDLHVKSDSGNSTSAFLVEKNDGTDVFTVDTANGRVGINATPSSYHSLADDLVVASSGDTGISIVSGTSSDGRIFFADGTSGSDESRGHIRYDHSDNSMHFVTNDGGSALSIDSSQNATFSGDVTISNTDALLNITSGVADCSCCTINCAASIYSKI